MRTKPVTTDDLKGVFAVPPLARANDATRSISVEQNNLIIRHIVAGGVKRIIYGGNAFLYHIRLNEYARLIEWLADLSDDLWLIPSVGPAYGLAMEQASLLRGHQFPCAMMLPSNDPRDASGLASGYREIADAAETPLLIYLKDEASFGADREAGIDAVARLIQDGICLGIKYAVVRKDPTNDDYLSRLLRRVDKKFVISGIGERPAIVHLRDWGLPGFTTGSGCIAPRLSQNLLLACYEQNWAMAEDLRALFIPLEDFRDQFGPAKVLHHATEAAGIAHAGPLPPYVSALSEKQRRDLVSVVVELMEQEESAALPLSLRKASGFPDAGNS